MSSTDASTAHGVRPGQPAPDLTVPLVGGGTFGLSERTPGRWLMVVFNRGLHCPVCQAQLHELDRRLEDLESRAIDLVAVSGETEERAQRMVDEWKLENLTIGYGLTENQMRAWGLFVSRGISENEPDVFSEPALFLVDPEGAVYYEAILSMPAGRPRLDDLLGGFDFWRKHDYPARGEA